MTLFSLPLWLIGVLFLPALLNLWGIWHAFVHEFPSPMERILWIVICVFIPLLGGIAYLLFGRPRTVRSEP